MSESRGKRVAEFYDNNFECIYQDGFQTDWMNKLLLSVAHNAVSCMQDIFNTVLFLQSFEIQYRYAIYEM